MNQWHEYNQAQTLQKLLFMDTLRELCQYVEHNRNNRGRPRLNIQEMIYCMGLLIYTRSSSRKIISDLKISKERNLITFVPHFNSILHYFNDRGLKRYLIDLITLSSLPLKDIEENFTVDATGFSTSVFGRWMDYKWDHNKKHRLWRKAHVMNGTKTHIVTSVEVTKGSTNDMKMFPSLVENTHRNFKMKRVCADLGYSSKKNLEIVSKYGAIPFIPFKKNVSGRSLGSYVWMRMYKYFQENNDEFMKFYHARSNSESFFSMIKRNLGSHLRTKNSVAQDNEILVKCLVHNICVLISESFELGISVDFCAESRIAQKRCISG